MKLIKACVNAMIVSMVVWTLTLLAIMAIISMVTADSSIFKASSDSWFVAAFLTVIYLVIQTLLSLINLAQAIYFESKGGEYGSHQWLHPFYIAEIILYCVVFAGFSFAFRWAEFVAVIFAFSIPYVICCTASVHCFQLFKDRTNKSEPNESSAA